MAIQFRLTPEEFIDGQRLYIRAIAPMSQRLCHQAKVPLGAVLILLSCYGVAVGQTEVIVLPVLALGVYLILLRYGLFTHKLRKAYAKYPNLQKEQRYEFSEEHIFSRAQYSDGNIRWELVTKYAESATLFTVQLSPRMFFIIPKRAFSDTAQLQAFRDLLARKASAAKAP
ncbi:MAG TPA: YcxB family protein [Terriglobales bacterium]|nr:YcxB family protein [Terriglobales bacterium]